VRAVRRAGHACPLLPGATLTIALTDVKVFLTLCQIRRRR
jgi:hypothetical protein